MAPDDIPAEHPAEDSTGAGGSKPSKGKGPPGTVGAEGEVRGGAEAPEDLPIEQQERRDRPGTSG